VKRAGSIVGAVGTGCINAAGLLLIALLGGCDRGAADDMAVVGEARPGAISLALPKPTRPVAITQARVPGRPLVVIDPGHGGRDPGASGVAGGVREKDVTLTLARELRDRLAKGGRVRVALTHDGDATLALDDRSAIARQLGAALFVSIHADSASNPEARGATIYSLSDIASDADAARLAAAQEANGEAISSATDGSVRAILADLATQDIMESSAEFAGRLLRKAQGRVELRPDPHRFAAFRVLRRADAPAVLFEAGYLSNVEDEAILTDPARRARIVAALADAIEAQLAIRR
jgi:N-acetylmuramoyl-L-alanine amidase